MKRIISFLTILLVLAACGSSKSLEERDHQNLKRDYEVRDASSPKRPGWIEDAEVWAQENNQDVNRYRFFSFETTPKVDRGIACSLAKSKAKADIAGEIATFIEKTLATSVEGRASIDENNPNTQGMREFVENTLAEKTMAMIHGAAVAKTYWEKRKYMESKGAAKDFIGYTCSVLVRMDGKKLESAIKRAAETVAGRADDPETKANVKKALKDVSENFSKARQGLL